MSFLYNNLYSVTKNCISGGTNYVALAIGIICIVGLLLPTQGEQNQRLPDYLHLSMNFKLIFSFVLGKHDGCVCMYVYDIYIYIKLINIILFCYRYGCKYCFRSINPLFSFLYIEDNFIYRIDS